MTDEKWLVKTRQYSGGLSIVDMKTTKEAAERVAEKLNTDYQTDRYYAEKFKEKN